MHYKELLGSIVRLGFCILGPDFCLVLHGLRCRKTNPKDELVNHTLQCIEKRADEISNYFKTNCALTIKILIWPVGGLSCVLEEDLSCRLLSHQDSWVHSNGSYLLLQVLCIGYKKFKVTRIVLYVCTSECCYYRKQVMIDPKAFL